ncbi:PREDICTED: ERV-BabFcenv provirus ancestral Env polyprotein-like, partial [Condylura cristata]|uniref:ERV-BabFcenv provirus ancestral Env polyprotein-like n=1 Tax=Condylura cristata TaxID=143302 RepID=UPI000643868D
TRLPAPHGASLSDHCFTGLTSTADSGDSHFGNTQTRSFPTKHGHSNSFSLPRGPDLRKGAPAATSEPRWTGPHLVILTPPTAVKLQGFPQRHHLSRANMLPLLQRTRLSTPVNPWGRLSSASRESLNLPHLLLGLSLLPLAFSAAGTKYTWQFQVLAVDKGNKVLNSTFCPTVSCDSALTITFNSMAACSQGCITTNPEVWTHFTPYLCLMSDQTASYCKDPAWGGCPYWSCIYHYPGRSGSRLVNLPRSNMVTFTIQDPWDKKWQDGVSGAVYQYWKVAPQGKIKIIRTRQPTPQSELDVVTDVTKEAMGAP